MLPTISMSRSFCDRNSCVKSANETAEQCKQSAMQAVSNAKQSAMQSSQQCKAVSTVETQEGRQRTEQPLHTHEVPRAGSIRNERDALLRVDVALRRLRERSPTPPTPPQLQYERSTPAAQTALMTN